MQSRRPCLVSEVDVNIAIGEGSKKQLPSLSLALEFFPQDGVQEKTVVWVSVLLVQLFTKRLYRYRALEQEATQGMPNMERATVKM